MVTLIVGPVNSGKTTKMATLYKKTGGDGLLCPKYLENGSHTGYNLTHLATGESIPFVRAIDALPQNWHEAFTFGSWSFSTQGQEMAAKIIETALQTGISPIFLDEIGPVELNGRGFAPLLRLLVKSGKETVITLRDFLTQNIVNFFEIKEYQIYKEQK